MLFARGYRHHHGNVLANTPGHCVATNDYNGDLGVRISAVFVILVGSIFGACFPTFVSRRGRRGGSSWPFFFAKFFGSGVIVATAFIHLLAPANDALSDPCLTGPITEYDWVEGICLITIFVLFIIEFIIMRLTFKADGGHGHSHGQDPSEEDSPRGDLESAAGNGKSQRIEEESQRASSHLPGEDHLGHSREHVANEAVTSDSSGDKSKGGPDSYSAQLTAVFILEFGIIFHSIFIGLTLAVSGDEFSTLYVVLVFHQTFEGLGLGSRLSTFPWPKNKQRTPYYLGLGYAFSTPIAIAVGLGVRNTYPPGSQTALITNGVFDSISAGILIYTALVELMAHEFMFSPTMLRASWGTICQAIGFMVLGAGLMALLGEWA